MTAEGWMLLGLVATDIKTTSERSEVRDQKSAGKGD
jgi:hypothetical protein